MQSPGTKKLVHLKKKRSKYIKKKNKDVMLFLLDGRMNQTSD